MITLLDIILIGVMLISALLAMIRGFMREVLSIAAWVIATVATVFAIPRLGPIVKDYFSSWPEIVSVLIVAVGVFLFTLLVVSILTVRFSDMVLDSRIGALDRTLGFLFGLARGLIIVAVAYVFFDWFVPTRQPSWVSEAKSRVVLKRTGEWLQSLVPDDLEKYLSAWLRRRQRPDDTEPADAPREGGASLDPRTMLAAAAYVQNDRVRMRDQVEDTATGRIARKGL